MRLLLAQLAPRKGDPNENLERIRRLVGPTPGDLAVFPELYLTGYRVGDHVHRLALRPGDEGSRRLSGIAQEARSTVAVGAPVVLDRPGEVGNAVVVAAADGTTSRQLKRYLPSYGPFEEGSFYTPTDRSFPIDVAGHRVGFLICYDAFFPEVTRELALAGAELLVVVSASPVTSRRLFEKVLPARAVENAIPLVYVNRVGVEDGVVFGGGTCAWDARGELIPLHDLALEGGAPEEGAWTCDIDLDDAPRWRPFRPVLRDVASRPPTTTSSHPSSRTHGL
jgi:predicted amidohydrolase